MLDAETGHPPEVLATASLLAPLLMEDLRRQAHRERRRVRAGETLRTTALVNEAYVKLQRAEGWKDEVHFLSAAALAMRQALVDHARARLAQKRGSGQVVALEDQSIEPAWESDEQLVALDEALKALSRLNPRLTHIVECRFFAGYSEEETARLLGVTDRTVRRDWVKARAWLFSQLGEETPDRIAS